MAKSLVDKLLDGIFDAEWVGKRGEKLTERELMWVRLFGRKGKVLRNVYLPKENGETSEVDVIYITQKGIFVFESKNYSGWIFGEEKNTNWTATLPNNQKNQFYNPIKQNKTHMKWMRNYVGDDIPLFSIIVFSERCELKKVNVESSDIKVIKRDKTYITVKEIWDANPDVVSDMRIEALYVMLEKLTNVDESVKLAHIESVEKRFKNNSEEKAGAQKVIPKQFETGTDISQISREKEEIKEEATKTDEKYIFADTEVSKNANPKVCPKCGSPLVIRTAKKGNNAGNKFYGCSAFPKCRFIQSL